MFRISVFNCGLNKIKLAFYMQYKIVIITFIYLLNYSASKAIWLGFENVGFEPIPGEFIRCIRLCVGTDT